MKVQRLANKRSRSVLRPFLRTFLNCRNVTWNISFKSSSSFFPYGLEKPPKAVDQEMNRTKCLSAEIDLGSSMGERRVHRDRRKRRASLGDRKRTKAIVKGDRRIKGKRAFLRHFESFFVKGHKHEKVRGHSQLYSEMLQISIGLSYLLKKAI